jgi:hypothetical protein
MEEWRYNSTYSRQRMDVRSHLRAPEILFLGKSPQYSLVWAGWAPEPMWVLGRKAKFLPTSGFESRLPLVPPVYWPSYNGIRRWRDWLGMTQGNKKKTNNCGIKLLSSWRELSGNKSRGFYTNAESSASSIFIRSTWGLSSHSFLGLPGDLFHYVSPSKLYMHFLPRPSELHVQYIFISISLH